MTEEERKGRYEYVPILDLLGCLYLEDVTNPGFREHYKTHSDFKLEKNKRGTLILRKLWVEYAPEKSEEEKMRENQARIKEDERIRRALANGII